MRPSVRKSTPKVVDGKVQKKNHQGTTFNFYDNDLTTLAITRRKPGAGCRHVLTIKDIQEFIKLLPDWPELSQGLNAIVLENGNQGWWGQHAYGVIHLAAWDVDLHQEWEYPFFKEHKEVLDRLAVPYEDVQAGVLVKFNLNSAKAFQLLHIFLHELGHHHDRITSKGKLRTTRGEPYAERYALEYEAKIWGDYLQKFPLY